MHPKKPWGWLVLTTGLLLLLIVMTWTSIDLGSQLNTAKQNLSKLKNHDMSIQTSAAMAVNQKFLEQFFNYDSTAQRYVGIKPLMTEQGYKATFPSGNDVPQNSQNVTSRMEGLRSYSLDRSNTEIEFLNQFKLSTEYKGNSTTQTDLVRTVLTNDKGSWRVSDIEFITQAVDPR